MLTPKKIFAMQRFCTFLRLYITERFWKSKFWYSKNCFCI